MLFLLNPYSANIFCPENVVYLLHLLYMPKDAPEQFCH